MSAVPAPGARAPWHLDVAVGASLGQKGFWGVGDQALMSGANFITMVLLARGLAPAAFGWFTLAYTFLLLANSVQAALFTQPHNVLGTPLAGMPEATRQSDQYRAYTTSTALGQALFLLAMALPVALAARVAASAGWAESGLLAWLLAAMVAWQAQEFVRRVLYTEGRLGAAFANDIIGYGGQALAVAGLWGMGRLTETAALGALAATSLAAAALGSWQLRLSFGATVDLEVLAQNWAFGKWLLAQEMVSYWIAAQLYLFLAALLVGPAAAAMVKVAQVLFGPLRVIALWLDTTLPIAFARTLRAAGAPAVGRQLQHTCAVLIPTISAYCLGVAIFAEPLLGLVYGESYREGAAVLRLFALYALVSAIQLIVCSALRARQLTRSMFLSTAYAGLVALGAGWLLVLALGTEGAVLGMLLNALGGTGLLWLTHRRQLLGDA